MSGKEETGSGKNLDSMSAKELGSLFPIRLVESRDEWGAIFKAEKIRVVNAICCKNVAGITHIGSTAIPDIMSKPTIDILLALEEDADIDRVLAGMKSIGYHVIPRSDNPAPHLMFVKGYTKHGFDGQAFHVHARYAGEHDEIIFRDYLISHPDAAVEYEFLKLELAAKFRHDREAYTEGKGNFVSKILRKASLSIGN